MRATLVQVLHVVKEPDGKTYFSPHADRQRRRILSDSSLEENISPSHPAGRYDITAPDGKKTKFHDRAVQFLVVDPDSETRELEPVVTRGAESHVSQWEAGL